jgi:transposase-like protein
MAKARPPYTPEFRRQMVELVRAGRSPEELAREFEPKAQSIRKRVGQAERDAGRVGPPSRSPRCAGYSVSPPAATMRGRSASRRCSSLGGFVSQGMKDGKDCLH